MVFSFFFFTLCFLTQHGYDVIIHKAIAKIVLLELVWWLWRMCNTRSHPELDSETVQRL